jgi:ABC-2 type transport system ATP-binding protein
MGDIVLKGVNKVIKKIPVLNDVDLELEKGNIYGLYGKNGSGKTMLIRMIAGLIIPNSGEVTVFGKTLGKDTSFPENMGLTIENVGFWPNYTGKECLRMVADVRKVIGDEEIDASMKRVGLDPDDKRKYKQYSLGMKQKLAIAQAIMEKPELIMLDEPTNSLDEETVDKLKSILIEEKERGALIIVASHDREDLYKIADKVFIVSDGYVRDPDRHGRN